MRFLFLVAITVSLGLGVLGAQTAKKTPPPAAPSKAAMVVSMPPFPTAAYSPARPVDVTRAVYKFAAEHPEVLKFVPCYCGCESSGHRANESCFVKRRDAKGNVVEWDQHGYDCQVCIDVGRESMLMFNSGADPVAIRTAIEKKWTPKHQTKTPTPLPVKKGK